MFKSMTAALAALALAIALVPGVAFADDLVAGEQPAASDTVEMHVLSKIGDMSCTYNAKGLLSKRVNASTTVTFKYSGSNIKSYAVKFTHGRSKSTTKGTLTYKKGRLAKLVVKASTGKSTDKYTYNASGQVKRYTHSATNRKKVKYACAYDSAGRLASRNASGGDKTKTTFAYDSKGNLASTTNKYGSGGYTQTFANSYDKAGRLTERVATITSAGSYSTSTKYEYRTISVPAQYADLVEQQQWALLNPQVSFSYPLSY